MLNGHCKRFAQLGTAISGALLMAGCASLPTSGPTANELISGTRANHNTIGMEVVDIDGGVIARMAEADAGGRAGLTTLASLARDARADVVGPGDQLDIAVFEVGASLFGGSRSGDGLDTSSVAPPSAQAQHFPSMVVDRAGTIRLPYAGTIEVSGHTPDEIEQLIEQRYRGKSQSPQVMVTIRTNLSNTVYVTGDVRRPGRVELTLQGEHLLDAIGIAGGSVAQTQDMVVRVTRDGRRIEQRLDQVRAASPEDLVLVPGDRVELLRQPQTYVILGAAYRPSQVSFDQSNLTLAEAVGRAGGPNDASANPRAVFLFRYDSLPGTVDASKPSDATPLRPIIYRLNMMQPSSYFLAQRFAMRDKDVLYVSNAGINRTAKFVSIINQLFSPFVAARAVAGN